MHRASLAGGHADCVNEGAVVPKANAHAPEDAADEYEGNGVFG